MAIKIDQLVVKGEVIAFFARGHHNLTEFADACQVAADYAGCSTSNKVGHEWWAKAPCKSGLTQPWQYIKDQDSTRRGSFRVTAMHLQEWPDVAVDRREPPERVRMSVPPRLRDMARRIAAREGCTPAQAMEQGLRAFEKMKAVPPLNSPEARDAVSTLVVSQLADSLGLRQLDAQSALERIDEIKAIEAALREARSDAENDFDMEDWP